MSNTDGVMAFCNAWTGPDVERALTMLSDDIFYHNIPMQPLSGKADVSAYLLGAAAFEDCRWDVLHIAEAGEYVLTERVDRMKVAGHDIVLPVMGTFRVRDGLICEWRDYFDLASYQAQWPAGIGGGGGA